MIEFSRDNFYKYKPNTISILLIDKNAALSGEAMKQLNYRQPDIYGALKQRLQKLGDKVQVGSIIKIDKFYFIVARENYHKSWNNNAFKLAWEALVLKVLNQYAHTCVFDSEDYEWIIEILQNSECPHSGVKICNHCAFGDDWE